MIDSPSFPLTPSAPFSPVILNGVLHDLPTNPSSSKIASEIQRYVLSSTKFGSVVHTKPSSALISDILFEFLFQYPP
jgi:hypothetical protein